MRNRFSFILLPGLMLLSACGSTQQDKSPAKQYPVLSIQESEQVLSSEYSALIKGWQTVEIRPQVGGTITDIRINEGDAVRKGAVLFVIDQLPYQAAYDIAVANVNSAEASLATAQLVLDSNRELLEQHVVSDFDIKTSENDLAEARARLALARAQELTAQNNLSYTEVRSPVNGVAGMIPYRVGALVNSSISAPLVTVSDDSKVYAYFSMSESQMLDLILEYGSLRNALSQMPEVGLKMSNGSIYNQKGRIDAISGIINESTGAISIRAIFPNPDRLLREGGSGTVVIPMHYDHCIIIPKTATFELQDRVFVYKVIEGRTRSQEIKVVKINNGRDYIVQEGLELDDIIISEGAGLLREGMEVKVLVEKLQQEQ